MFLCVQVHIYTHAYICVVCQDPPVQQDRASRQEERAGERQEERREGKV